MLSLLTGLRNYLVFILVGAQGYGRFIPNIAHLHAESATRLRNYLVSSFPIHSALFSPNFADPEQSDVS